MRNRDLILLGALAVGGFLAWQYFDKKLKEAADKAAKFIADPIIAATVGPTQRVNAFAILPSGQRLDMNALASAVKKTPGKEEFTFTYQNRRYLLLPRNAQGDYPARLVA